MWHKHWIETIYVGQWPIFRGPVILPYILKTIWWTNVITGILDPCDAKVYHIKVCRSVTYISWSSDFALYLEDFLMDKCHTCNWNTGSMWCKDLQDKMYVGQWPTFMVQRFCLISWRLFDGLMLYWRYWFSVTQTLNWNYICRPMTYILWSSDFALYLDDYLIDRCHNWNIGSMWCKD